MMAKKFNNLRSKMTPEAQALSQQKTQEILEAMPLADLRHALELSQLQLATTLHTNQASISKMERRTDMYISTLRNFLEAMGGELEITAKFHDRSIKINQFEDLKTG